MEKSRLEESDLGPLCFPKYCSSTEIAQKGDSAPTSTSTGISQVAIPHVHTTSMITKELVVSLSCCMQNISMSLYVKYLIMQNPSSYSSSCQPKRLWTMAHLVTHFLVTQQQTLDPTSNLPLENR